MRRALLDQSGTVGGLDYRGEMVLAAYEPVAELNLGIVAKIDMSEVRAPFMKAGLIGLLFTVLVVLIGTSLFVRITNPMIRQLEDRTLELNKSNKDMKVEIEERKQAEEELQESEKLLQTVFDGISDPLLLLDKSLKVMILNTAAKNYYQVAEDRNINNICCYIAFRDRLEPCEGCPIPAALASNKSVSIEHASLINPKRLEQVVIYNFGENKHKFDGAIIRIHDITEARMMERKMIQSEKMASLGLMVSCIAHEITNPVSAITFNAPILKDYTNAMISIVDDYAEDIQDFELFQMPYPQFRKDTLKIIENILHASERIKSTVSDLRKLYGNKKQQTKRWSDLKHVIERAIAMVGVEINKCVKSFEVNIPENFPKIHTDSY